MKLGRLELETEAVVADIEDDVLIGVNVLCGKGREAADLLLSRNVLILQGVKYYVFR
jgi:tetrahydrodipicolinate N-succinyltransferase